MIHEDLYSIINSDIVNSDINDLTKISEKIKYYILSLESLYNTISMIRPYLLVVNEINKDNKGLIDVYPYKDEIRMIYSEIKVALQSYSNLKTRTINEGTITLTTSGTKAITLINNLQPILKTFKKISDKNMQVNLSIAIRALIELIDDVYINKKAKLNIDNEQSYKLYKTLWNNGFPIGKRIISQTDYFKNKDSTKTLTEGLYLFVSTAHYILGPIQRVFQIIVSILRNNESNIELLNIISQ